MLSYRAVEERRRATNVLGWGLAVACCLIAQGCNSSGNSPSTGCATDLDCKGDRICSEGECVDAETTAASSSSTGSGGGNSGSGGQTTATSTGSGGSGADSATDLGSQSSSGGVGTRTTGGNGGSGGSGGSAQSSTGGSGGNGPSSTGGSSSGGTGSATCDQIPKSDTIAGKTVRRLAVTYRDFTAMHADFGTAPEQCDGWQAGMVADVLTDGLPTLVSGTGACTTPETFADWFSDGSSSTTVKGELVLFDDGTGGYVNRFGPEGEQWLTGPGQPYADVYLNCEDGGRDLVNTPSQCGPRCTLDQHETCYPTAAECPNFSSACKYIPPNTPLDGTPLFFPLDDVDGAAMVSEARIPEQYGWSGWPWEIDATGYLVLHNFYFTSELRFWFEYDANGPAPELSFTGDDDVWVFLNEQLVVDLGGMHVPISGSFEVDANTAASYGLSDGQVYEVALFHAERRIEGSSFRLRLQGFDFACP